MRFCMLRILRSSFSLGVHFKFSSALRENIILYDLDRCLI